MPFKRCKLKKKILTANVYNKLSSWKYIFLGQKEIGMLGESSCYRHRSIRIFYQIVYFNHLFVVNCL